ncbi:UDP-N-acetylmuramoyl-L-alanine--D-glutamate ligase [Candidatus Curtissbacteria bacterium]|nr:UDP-N-acetylmuramoyl-L-alanine--D-glutamate ligase [Candidatus Curtissbacteria bacterium]
MFEYLNGKKIIVLGIGKEGLSTLNFLRSKLKNISIAVADEQPLEKLSKDAQVVIKNDPSIELCLGKDYLKDIEKYDLVFKTPGIPSKKIPAKTNITSQAEIFLELFGNQIIGVTGTKGKSTTASLIYKILKDAGKDAELVGNIGSPALDHLKDTTRKIFVYELSSYQLENVKASPHIAVLLNIFEEHLDYHGTLDSYAKAKANITKWQSENDFIVFNQNSGAVKAIVDSSPAQKVSFSAKDESKFFQATKLKGKHNQNNILAAAAVASILKIPPAAIKKSIEGFEPLKYRLEFVAKRNGIEFYNDSISTIPESTIAALQSLAPNVSTLILGGLNRGVNYKTLAQKIIDEKIENLILFPETGQIVEEELKKIPSLQPNCQSVSNMKDAVAAAAKITPWGKICLLSPAAASFNIFRDYQDRGDQFTTEVLKLKS